LFKNGAKSLSVSDSTRLEVMELNCGISDSSYCSRSTTKTMPSISSLPYICLQQPRLVRYETFCLVDQPTTFQVIWIIMAKVRVGQRKRQIEPLSMIEMTWANVDYDDDDLFRLDLCFHRVD